MSTYDLLGRNLDAPMDTADYGMSSGPQDRGPDETNCRNCGFLALDHSEARYSVYGTCPTLPTTVKAQMPRSVTQRGQERPGTESAPESTDESRETL